MHLGRRTEEGYSIYWISLYVIIDNKAIWKGLNKMNRKELKKTLEELGIPEGAVSLNGEARPACISLKALRNNVWQVFFIEDFGIQSVSDLFDSEEDACKHVLQMVLGDLDYFQRQDVKDWYAKLLTDPEYIEFCRKLNANRK